MMKRINDLELQLQGAQHQIGFFKQANRSREKAAPDQSEEMIEFACLDDRKDCRIVKSTPKQRGRRVIRPLSILTSKFAFEAER